MAKLEQTVLSWGEDASERCDQLEEALSGIESAMEALRGYGEFAVWFDDLSELVDAMEQERDELDRQAADEYIAEMDEMTSDYWRSVI